MVLVDVIGEFCSTKYSGASLYDCPTLRWNRITTIFLRLQLWSQNHGPNWVFSLCNDWFPASGTNSLQNDDFKAADWRFQNGHWVNKMAPRCFLSWIPRKTGSENSCPMEDLRWTVSFDPTGMHWRGFNGFFSSLRCFRLTAVFLERIIAVKRGTTV